MSFLNVDSHNDHKSQQNIDKTKHHHANYSFKDYLNIEGIFFKSVEQFFLSDMCMDRPSQFWTHRVCIMHIQQRSYLMHYQMAC